MRTYILAFIVSLMAVTGAFAQRGQQLTPVEPVALRAAAALTTSSVQGTSITLPADTTALVVYLEFTKGSADAAVITPAVQATANGKIFSIAAKAITLSATGKYAVRIPAEDLCGRFPSFQYIATTSGASTSLAVWYKLERK